MRVGIAGTHLLGQEDFERHRRRPRPEQLGGLMIWENVWADRFAASLRKADGIPDRQRPHPGPGHRRGHGRRRRRLTRTQPHHPGSRYHDMMRRRGGLCSEWPPPPRWWPARPEPFPTISSRSTRTRRPSSKRAAAAAAPPPRPTRRHPGRSPAEGSPDGAAREARPAPHGGHPVRRGVRRGQGQGARDPIPGATLRRGARQTNATDEPDPRGSGSVRLLGRTRVGVATIGPAERYGSEVGR